MAGTVSAGCNFATCSPFKVEGEGEGELIVEVVVEMVGEVMVEMVRVVVVHLSRHCPL